MSPDRTALAADLAETLAPLPPAARLAAIRAAIPGRIVFTTSFGLEDQVLTELIFSTRIDIEVVTLDTGRLFPQTYQLWSETEQRYGKRIRAVYPERAGLEALVGDQGIDGMYLSVASRKACCDVRKVEPLKRALAGAAAWVTGLRGGQSAGRGALPVAQFDAGFGLVKLNPLIDVLRQALAEAIAARAIPVNPLHVQGFPSIGCAPCTRAIQPGEDERAGRWWWENESAQSNNAKECGLHVASDGALVRAKEPA